VSTTTWIILGGIAFWIVVCMFVGFLGVATSKDEEHASREDSWP
jgi:hypothetical protein